MSMRRALATGDYTPESRVIDRQTCIANWCPSNYTRSFAGAMTLTTALARSINTIPVQLTSAVGNGNNRNGRKIITALIARLGVETPLRTRPRCRLARSR